MDDASSSGWAWTAISVRVMPPTLFDHRSNRSGRIAGENAAEGLTDGLGDVVVVIGLGPVGVFALQCAQLFGPSRILAVDTVPERLARAEALGAEPIDASAGSTPAQVLAATGGRGAQRVIEAVGLDQTISDALFCCALGGTISVIGVNLNFQFPLPAPLLLLRRLTLRMTLASIPTTWSALVPLIERGKLHPEDVFTHRMGLSEAAEAYRTFDGRLDGCLKVLLDPSS